MSYGDRLRPREIRIEAGGVYSNDLSERHVEERRVDRIEEDHVFFTVTSGKRAGRQGNCHLTSFWLWLRKRV